MQKNNLLFTLNVGRKLFAKDYSYQALRSRLNADHVTTYLTTTSGIIVPEDFAVQLCSTHSQFYRTTFNMSINVIDSIIDVCELFREYVYDIDELICFEILSMVRIHTCVINNHTLSKNLVKLKKQIPKNFQAIVRKNGSIEVCSDLEIA